MLIALSPLSNSVWAVNHPSHHNYAWSRDRAIHYMNVLLCRLFVHNHSIYLLLGDCHCDTHRKLGHPHTSYKSDLRTDWWNTYCGIVGGREGMSEILHWWFCVGVEYYSVPNKKREIPAPLYDSMINRARQVRPHIMHVILFSAVLAK